MIDTSPLPTYLRRRKASTMPAIVDLSPVYDFLPCRTPEAWLSVAVGSLPLLMIDHANCEKKAAATAMSLMHRHTDNTALLNKMSRLAREELRTSSRC